MTFRIYIKELTKELGFKDQRAAMKWCERQHIGILSDFGSKKRRYVIRAEFIAKYMNDSVKYISRKYGKDKLPEFLNSEVSFFVEQTPKKMEEYKPQGEKEKSFLSILQKITSPV